MMNILTKNFDNCDIRLVEINGEVWWNLKDVCTSLGMSPNYHRKVKERHNSNHFQGVSFRHPSRNQNIDMIAVNQKGLLRIIWKSEKPNAVVFSDWCADVMSEVLQTGRYDVREHEEQIQRLQRDLNSTQAQLAEERAEVERRVFLVIKDAVSEYRMENGFRNTDFKWRNTHFGQCCSRLLGTIYKKGATPFVRREFMDNAKQSIKTFYEFCQHNPQSPSPPMTQQTITNHFARTETVNIGR